MNFEFLSYIRPIADGTKEEKDAMAGAIFEMVALDGLRNAGGSSTVAEFYECWGDVSISVLRQLLSSGFVTADEHRIELTQAGRSAMQC